MGFICCAFLGEPSSDGPQPQQMAWTSDAKRRFYIEHWCFISGPCWTATRDNCTNETRAVISVENLCAMTSCSTSTSWASTASGPTIKTTATAPSVPCFSGQKFLWINTWLKSTLTRYHISEIVTLLFPLRVYAFLLLLGKNMEEVNPWLVDSIMDFTFFCCPECHFRSKIENIFQEHALQSHPQVRYYFETSFKTRIFDDNQSSSKLHQSCIALHHQA